MDDPPRRGRPMKDEPKKFWTFQALLWMKSLFRLLLLLIVEFTEHNKLFYNFSKAHYIVKKNGFLNQAKIIFWILLGFFNLFNPNHFCAGNLIKEERETAHRPSGNLEKGPSAQFLPNKLILFGSITSLQNAHLD